jgi:hypothetical protein
MTKRLIDIDDELLDMARELATPKPSKEQWKKP